MYISGLLFPDSRSRFSSLLQDFYESLQELVWIFIGQIKENITQECLLNGNKASVSGIKRVNIKH